MNSIAQKKVTTLARDADRVARYAIRIAHRKTVSTVYSQRHRCGMRLFSWDGTFIVCCVGSCFKPSAGVLVGVPKCKSRIHVFTR